MHQPSLRSIFTASALTLLFMGAGCASSTTTETNVTADVDTDVAGIVLENTNTDVTADAIVNTNTIEDTATAATKTFDVVASQFEFSPNTLTVNQGDTVVINLSSADVPHGFALPDFGVTATITPGKTKTVEFVADQTGSFSFTCSVVCGAGHSGMQGTLVVN